MYSPKERRGSKICVLRLKRRRLSFFLFFFCSALSYISREGILRQLPCTWGGYRIRTAFTVFDQASL